MRQNLLKSIALTGALAGTAGLAVAQPVYNGDSGYYGQPDAGIPENTYSDGTYADVYQDPDQPEVEEGYVDTQQFEQPLAVHGRWVTVATYGRAWVPVGVAAGWRPYTLGHWVWTDYGWTWASDEPFGWATYHYGRWLFTADFGWVWLPGSVWAPAWVDWRFGGGYIGWAPLPPRHGFRFALRVSHFDHYAIPATYFNFCVERDFCEPHVHRHFVPRERNVTIINRTTNITNITVVNNHVVNKSVSVERIERARGQRIERLAVKPASKPGAAHVAGKELAVYRPAATSKRPPAPAAKSVGPVKPAVKNNAAAHNNAVTARAPAKVNNTSPKIAANNPAIRNNGPVRTATPASKLAAKPGVSSIRPVAPETSAPTLKNAASIRPKSAVPSATPKVNTAAPARNTIAVNRTSTPTVKPNIVKAPSAIRVAPKVQPRSLAASASHAAPKAAAVKPATASNHSSVSSSAAKNVQSTGSTAKKVQNKTVR